MEERQRIESLEGTVNETARSVERIEQALLGWQGEGGLINEMRMYKSETRDATRSLESRIIILENEARDRKAVASWRGGMWGAGSGIVIALIAWGTDRLLGA